MSGLICRGYGALTVWLTLEAILHGVVVGDKKLAAYYYLKQKKYKSRSNEMTWIWLARTEPRDASMLALVVQPAYCSAYDSAYYG